MPIKVLNIIVDVRLCKRQGLYVRVGRVAAHVGNRAQLIFTWRHALGYGLFVLLHLCNICPNICSNYL